jgi:16S rRNA (adenine1518-N6/adenine1519-N6)-dimethyltransferase
MNRPSDDTLPPLREVIKKHELAAKKSFGQNFLLDLNLTRKIARAVPDILESFVYEVGPGPGGLSRALLMEGAWAVHAIEKDARCLPALAEIKAQYTNFTFSNADAKSVDETSFLPAGTGLKHICANLPYNVGTALLVKWMTGTHWKPWFSSLTLMFQREVAERIVARPGTKAYGRLSILCQWRAQANILFDVSPKAFTPPPKVTSSVIQIIPAAPAVEGLEIRALERLSEMVFGQRRKMLRASLKPLGKTIYAAMEKLEIEQTSRPEMLSVKTHASLAKELQSELLGI